MQSSQRSGRILRAAAGNEKQESTAVVSEKRPRGRPPKYPPTEVRRRLIDAAIATLRVSGVESGLDAVTLDGAIIDADVPRGMSYKIWREGEQSPQDAFRRAAVLDLLSIPAVAGLPATREFTTRLIDMRRADIGSDDLSVRKAAIVDLIREVGEYNHQALAESENWRLYTALRSAAITRPHADPAMMEVLEKGEDYLIREYSQFYTETGEALGLELRPEFEMDQFSAAAYSINEGLAMRLASSYRQTGIIREGHDQPWTLFAVSLEALVFHFFDWKN